MRKRGTPRRRGGRPVAQEKGAKESPNPEFYTVAQLARLFQLTEMTIYRMVYRRDLACYSIGRMKRFRRSDVEAFLKRCRVPAAKGDVALETNTHQRTVL